MTAFGVTTWAVNRVGWAFGYNSYANPYAGGTTVIDNSTYDYSQPLVLTPDETTLAADPNDTAAPPEVSPESLSDFDRARQEFFAGDYQSALKSTDAALKTLPNDAVLHEFRALALFALGNYQDSAAVLYAVLSVGPGWDWTTLSGLYPSVSDYSAQLRKLEEHIKTNPQDPAGLFVLAYHYLTAGHDDAAVRQLKKLLEVAPNDQLAMQMLMDLDPEFSVPNPPKQVKPPKPEAALQPSDLQGSWTAKKSDETFQMTLKEDGTYSWNYSRGGQDQGVTGVWEVDDDGILALQMNDEGVMLAQLVLKNGNLDFYMLGDTQGQEPLAFSRSP